MAVTSSSAISFSPLVQNLSQSRRSSSLAHRLLNPCRRAPWRFHLIRPYSIPQASRRTPNSFSRASDVLLNQSRNWGPMNFGEDDDEYDEEEEDDRSLDLLVRFVENVFKKISRRARKAVKSILPVTISPRLVGFSVNGALILGFLWILKAFLEVICTLGSVVFVSILVIRGLWSGVSYLQENRNFDLHPIDGDRPIWTGAQPVT